MRNVEREAIKASMSSRLYLLLLLLPILYIVSVGPVLRFGQDMNIESTVDPVYEPIEWLYCQDLPVVTELIEWYVFDLWGYCPVVFH